jgi:hypothetical protein
MAIILTLDSYAGDQLDPWASGGAAQFTSETTQSVRDAILLGPKDQVYL